MEFIAEIWKKMAARYLEAFDREWAPLIARAASGRRKGGKSIPVSLVRDMLGDAYRAGAAAALKMADEIDRTAVTVEVGT